MQLNMLSARGKIILALIVFVLVTALVAAGVYAWQRHSGVAEELQRAKVLSEQQAGDINYLQNELGQSKQNAEMLSKYICEAAAGQQQPVIKFVQAAPTVQAAADQVAGRINAGDKALPPAALEKTDNTVVVPNTNKTSAANYDVGVFKVNNYRNWEWSAGIGQHGGDRYIPIGLQRNYSKDAAVSYERHLGGRQSGYEVRYVRKTDKLLFLF